MNKGIFKKLLIVLLLLALINVYFINIINPVMASVLDWEKPEDVPDEDDPPSVPPSNPDPPSRPDPPSIPDTPSTPDPEPEPEPEPEPPPPPPTYSISGNVFDDTNTKNGILDSNDFLLSGIKVTLFDENYVPINDSITTDSNGFYNFSDLSNGKYNVGFEYSNDTYNGLNYKSLFSPNDTTGSNAVDSQDRRLELMQQLSNMNYETSSNLNQINLGMSASSEVEILDSDTVCNLPLIRRPNYSVKMTKTVSHLTIVLSDGNTLIDWEPTQTVKHLMVLPEKSLTAIMDDELTHGAMIKLKYNITIENTSEFDNLSNYFSSEFLQNKITSNEELNQLSNLYGISNLMNISIPTKYYLYDYLSNNLIFDEDNNPNHWNVINNDNLLPHSNDMDLSNMQILANEATLKHGEKKTFTLNASKLMTITDADLLTYDNYVEVVAYKSILGNVLTYDDTFGNRKITIPGNLNIYDEERVKNLEPDEAKAETVTRVPPFGKDLSYYTTVIGIIVLAIEIVILSTLKIKIKHLKNAYIRKR